MINLKIVDGSGSEHAVKVSSNGELIIRPFDFATSMEVTMDADATAFNVWPPKIGKQFVITNILVSTNKDIGVNGSNIEIFEADAADSTTLIGSSFKVNLLKNANLPLTGLLSIIQEGNYLNAKHDDGAVNAEVFVTIGGYYVPKLE